MTTVGMEDHKAVKEMADIKWTVISIQECQESSRDSYLMENLLHRRRLAIMGWKEARLDQAESAIGRGPRARGKVVVSCDCVRSAASH